MTRLLLIPLPLLLCSCVADGPELPVISPKLVSVKQDKSGVRVVSASLPVTTHTPPAPKTKTLDVEVTAYCPCARCCGRMTGQTSTRSNAWQPGVAACPEAVPYGTLVKIPGYEEERWVVVDDTGGAMRRAWRQQRVIQLDVRMTYHWQARQWGRKLLTVEVEYPR